MYEYAILNDRGEVLEIVTTNAPVSELMARLVDPETGDFVGKVQLVDDVPLAALERYPHWHQRP